MVIKLVVARHIDHRPAREPSFRPLHTSYTHTDIARQNHDIGIGCRRREVLELDVQVISDYDTLLGRRTLAAE